ncbi:hypothetical protein H0E87_001618 [Populus deltoides]|uniref:Uncharacterized protein n=1 Tax=Populus deltoides TaxID=3696 RepID=A0A8T2ZS31_POPDE|nr:hypothetical protein H0E87_001618 [Populus deltoides]
MDIGADGLNSADVVLGSVPACLCFYRGHLHVIDGKAEPESFESASIFICLCFCWANQKQINPSPRLITAAINCTWNSVAGVNLSTVIYMYTNDGVTSRRPEELPPGPVKQSRAHNIPKKDAHVHCKNGMVER